MKALIDADRIPYALGNTKNESGTDFLKWPLVKARVDSMIDKVIDECDADSHTLYLTDSPSNFRINYAKILPYKGNRPTDKPYHFDKIRNYLLKFRDAHLSVGIEADDQLGIDQCKANTFAECTAYANEVCLEREYETKHTTIISSVDKDLDLIPGKHHNPISGKVYEITETQGLQNFYKQMLTGDTVDNILGLYGIGAKSAHLKNVEKLTDELDMYKYVKLLYQKYFGSFWYVYMVENGILLWILREEMTDPPYIVTRFKELEGECNGV